VPLPKSKYPHRLNYEKFKNRIYNGEYKGFLVVQNIAIKNDSRQSLHGFLVCKAPVLNKSHWSSFTNTFNPEEIKNTVCGVHHIPGFYVVHTSFFNFLKRTFGFEEPVNILHAVLYNHSPSLNLVMTRYLKQRRLIKDQLKETSNSLARLQLSIKSSTIKLLMNRRVIFFKIFSISIFYLRLYLCI